MRSNSIMKLAIAFAIGFLSFAVMASPSKRGAGAPKSMADLQRADTGFVHVAADGVARSYNQFGQVLDYVQLDSAKLDKFVASLPPTMPEEEKSEYKDLLAGVNGFDVKSKAQLASLSARLRPATSAPSEEQFTTANKAFEASYALQTDGKLPRCVGEPCHSNKGCQEFGCTDCMKPIGEHTVMAWCHYFE